MSKKVSIRSAADLLEALESTDFALQSAVMQMISKDPVKALSYGQHDGRDVVDVLITMGSAKEARLALLPCTTLAAFDDPRVIEFFLGRLEHGQGRVVALSTGYLMGCEIPRERVYPTLLAEESRLHVRAAARLLGFPTPNDPPEVALRLALLIPDCSLPPLDESWRSRWLGQLESLLAAEARAGIESLAQADALSQMLALRDELSPDNQRWLLDWGVRYDPGQVVGLLRASLQTDPAFTLSLLRKSPEALAMLAGELPVNHEDARIAAWARSLAAPTADSQTTDLVTELHSADWRARAQACEGLIAKGGSEVIHQARHLAISDRLELRVAGSQILMALGEHEWMEETLLARSN